MPTFSEVSDTLESQAVGVDSSVDELEQRDEIGRLMVEIDELPENYREVILLFYFGDHSYRELAEMFVVSSATINARLTKARALLRQRTSLREGTRDRED